jgi:hypothetical protein
MRVEREKVFLSRLNKEVFFDLMTLGTERKIQEEVGLENINKALTLSDPDTANESVLIILKTAWILLDINSKKDILKVKFTDIDSDGNETDIKFSKPEERFLQLVSGRELIAITMAIVKLSQKSMPLITETDKKKVTEEESLAK